MASIKINPRQLKALERKLGSLATLQKRMTKPMATSLLNIQAEMSIKPPKEAGAWTARATPKQKRAFWARVRSGEAKLNSSGSYIRTGGSTKWTSKINFVGGGLIGRVGNNAQAAPFIYGAPPPPGTQQNWLTNWPRVDKVFDAQEEAIIKRFNDFLAKELAK